EGLSLIRSLPCATGKISVAALDLKDIGTHAGDLVFHKLLRALPERHHRDYRGHTDHDTQHGECRLDLVLAKSVNRHLLNIDESHECAASNGCCSERMSSSGWISRSS